MSDAEHASFFKSLNLEDDLTVKHFTVEGKLGFRVVVFTPSCTDWFVKRRRNATTSSCTCVAFFIMDVCEEFTPEWFNFRQGRRGFGGSSSKHLSTLHQNKILRVIKKNLVKICFEMFVFFERAQKNDDYKIFLEQCLASDWNMESMRTQTSQTQNAHSIAVRGPSTAHPGTHRAAERGHPSATRQ